MIKIDEEEYEVGIVKVVRKATIDKEEVAVTQDGKKHIVAKGTYYDYEVTFATKKMNVTEYDRLYEVLTSPIDTHIVTMPYGQSNITFESTIDIGSDELISNYNTFKKWGTLKVTFESIMPQRVSD